MPSFLPPTLRRPLVLALLAGLATGCLSALLPDVFKAEARILPDTGRGTPPARAGVWAPAAPPAVPGIREDGPTVIFADILRSRRVAEGVLLADYAYQDRSWRFGTPKAARGSLLAYLGAADVDGAMGPFRRLLTVDRNPKSGLLTLAAETRSPELSRQVVARAVAELRRALVDLSQTEGRERARFAQDRLGEVRAAYEGRVDAFQRFQDANRNWETSASPTLRFQGAQMKAQLGLRWRVLENLTLNQEQALLEARDDVQALLVLDPGALPREKSGPHRAFLVFGAMAATGAVSWAAGNRSTFHDLFVAKEKT